MGMERSARSTQSEWRVDAALALSAAGLCIATFANVLTGDFVYDDTQQILQNPLIQDSHFLWQALTTDVWAFQGAVSGPVSHLWRPLFVLWLALNHRLFGFSSTIGWHVGSLMLHVLVVALAYGLLRHLRVAPIVAAVVVILFGVHPVQTESVAWISASPSMLAAAPLLGALLCFLRLRRPAMKWGMSLSLYAVSLLGKETGVVFPLVAFVLAYATSPAGMRARLRARRAAVAAVPFALVAAAFAAVRLIVLGPHELTTLSRHTPATVIATVPSVVGFYLQHIVFPYPLGPAYPLRPLEPSALSWENFILPLAVDVAVGLLLLRLVRHSPARQVGLALFVCSLAPVVNVDAFMPDRLVQDRYLYLPLLGLLMVVVPAAAASWETAWPGRPALARPVGLFAASVLCLLLMRQTVTYNRAWTSDLRLWEQGLRVHPDSSFNLRQYGMALMTVGRLQEADSALSRSIAIEPTPEAFTNRAIIAISDQRYADAEQHLRLVLHYMPHDLRAYEQLALCFHRQGRLDEGAAVLRTARDNVASNHGKITANLASLLYQAGRKQEALRELESVRDLVSQEPGPAGWRALYLLGMLRVELGRPAEAEAPLSEYVALTANATDPAVLKLRGQAEVVLQKLEYRSTTTLVRNDQ